MFETKELKLDKCTAKNRTENLLRSKRDNCKTNNKEIFTKPHKTLEFKLTQPMETLSFKPPISIERPWIVGIKSLEVYISISFETEENNELDFMKIFRMSFLLQIER